jgi:hypothetical protein
MELKAVKKCLEILYVDIWNLYSILSIISFALDYFVNNLHRFIESYYVICKVNARGIPSLSSPKEPALPKTIATPQVSLKSHTILSHSISPLLVLPTGELSIFLLPNQLPSLRSFPMSSLIIPRRYDKSVYQFLIEGSKCGRMKGKTDKRMDTSIRFMSRINDIIFLRYIECKESATYSLLNSFLYDLEVLRSNPDPATVPSLYLWSWYTMIWFEKPVHERKVD